MPMLTPEKALRSLRKTPAILRALLKDVSQQQAVAATDPDDAPDAWSALFVMCHLRDYEDIFTQRARLMLEQDYPELPTPMNNDQLIAANAYDLQLLRDALDSYVEKRRQFIHMLEGLTDAQWARRGVHHVSGESSVLELAINAALHDINHIEQIVRALGLAQTPA